MPSRTAAPSLSRQLRTLAKDIKASNPGYPSCEMPANYYKILDALSQAIARELIKPKAAVDEPR